MSSVPIYLDNVNLHVPNSLHRILYGLTVLNVICGAFTYWFQKANPNMEKNMGRLFLIIILAQIIDRCNYLC